MKLYTGALALTLALGCASATSLIAQDDHHEHDRDDRAAAQTRDESAYYRNPYYKRGWNNGLHHKQAHYHWKNDEDRQAYEAGYAQGERGEAWRNPNVSRHDRDDAR